MARHTIQIPITRSSHHNMTYYYPDIKGPFTPNPIGTVLYMQSFSYAGEGYWRNMAFGWELPEGLQNKIIISTTFHFYALNTHNRDIRYKIADFVEGGDIPSGLSPDGNVPGGFVTGWNTLSLGPTSGKSVVFRQFTWDDSRNIGVAKVYSHRNSNYKPYVVITYDDVPPNPPTNLAPSNTEVNKEDIIRLSWRHNSVEGHYQKGFTLQYSINNGANWTTISRTTPNQYYNLPANTFSTSGPVLWRVRTIDGNDEISQYSSTTFTTKTPPSPPTNLMPHNTELNPKNIIRFNWNHQSADGLTQKGFTLEYATNNQGNWRAISKTTSEQFYDMPANTFPLKGSVQWRVKTTDANDLVSGYGLAEFILQTPPDQPTSLYPNNITLNPREIIKFSWLHNSNSDLGQKDFTLQYSTNAGGTWETIEETTTNQYYDLPANTLPTSGTVAWNIKTTDGNGLTSEISNASFTLGTPPQQAPIPMQPIGAYLDSTEPIIFEWHFMGGTPGETQSKFKLQYSINNGTTWETVTEITDRKSIELPANTFNMTGNIRWRVKTYNNFDEESPYSDEKEFYVISSPPIPQITNISNHARPFIEWTSQGQHIYELQIIKGDKVIISSGSIPSVSDREYKLKDYLEDGNYKAKLRVINEYNLYSPYAEKAFTISTIKPQQPIIEVYNGEYTTTINISTITDVNLVYRDNILIGEAKDNKFIDFTGENNKEYKYIVRAVNNEDNFHDSDFKLGKCSFKNNTLATLQNPGEFIKLKYGLGNIPGKNKRIGVSAFINYYDGREYPIAEYSEFKSLEKTLHFSLRTREEVDELINLINKAETLIFRDFNGEVIKGTIFDLNYNKGISGYQVEFTITKTEV